MSTGVDTMAHDDATRLRPVVPAGGRDAGDAGGAGDAGDAGDAAGGSGPAGRAGAAGAAGPAEEAGTATGTATATATAMPPSGATVWLDVCAVDDVPRQGARVLRRPGRVDVAIFRNAAGAVFALLDRCPHRGGPLSQGIVHGERVACPLHGWSIGLADGEAAAPDVGCARAFAVRVAGGRVWMDAAQLRGAD